MKRYNYLEEFITETFFTLLECHKLDDKTSIEINVHTQYLFGKYYLKLSREITYDINKIDDLCIDSSWDSEYREYLPCETYPSKDEVLNHINLIKSQLHTFKLLCKRIKIPFKSNLIDSYETEFKLLKITK